VPASLKEVLGDLIKKPGVVAAVIASRDGFIIEAMSSDDEVDLEKLGALTCNALNNWESLGTELAVGEPQMLIVEFEPGPIAVMSIGGDAVLAVLGNRLCNLGRMRIETTRVREAVNGCL